MPEPIVPTLSTSVVIPAKDEARNIGWVLQRMPSFVDEVIVVDGLSRDGTLEVAKMIAPDVIAVHELRPGKGAALRAGFDAATGDCVVILDADGSMDPVEMERFVRSVALGADLVKGSRFAPGGGSTDITRLRTIGNRGLLGLTNRLFGTTFTELCYGYMAIRRSEIDRLELTADGFEIETQIVTRSVRAGLRIAEVPSQELERRHGQSNLRTFRDGWRVLRTIFTEWRRPVERVQARRPVSVEAEELFTRWEAEIGV